MKFKRGFTLIELMVVIAIIGILASIITVSLTSARAKGRDAKRVSDIRSIQLALEQYYNDNGYYPLSITGTISPTYISSVPFDPKDNITPYKYTSYNTSSNATGVINCAGKATTYHLAAVMDTDDTSNPALKQDYDGAYTSWTACTGTPTGNFHGNATACSGTSAGPVDNCYDQTSN